ncbi:DUF2953 domain-containing protein [Massilibacterium senegalense]|uniref:DUF2953 domain-containing protein n=1 Tax=Massilibacterium senegalense TaxID=1632858 RepID=UPI00078571B0|nr:DUF2953 domain-containing protein [Massilibacterium senegalense]
MWSLLIVVCFILFFILLFCMRITVIFQYQHHEKKDHLMVQIIFLYGLVRLKKELSYVALSNDLKSVKMKTTEGEKKKWTLENTKNSIKNMQKFVHEMEDVYRTMHAFLQSVHVKKLEWATSFGVADAYTTALLSGTLWTIKGTVQALLYQFCHVEKRPVFSVHPHFSTFMFSVMIEGIVSIRFGQAIKVAYRFAKRNVRRNRQHDESSN